MHNQTTWDQGPANTRPNVVMCGNLSIFSE